MASPAVIRDLEGKIALVTGATSGNGIADTAGCAGEYDCFTSYLHCLRASSLLLHNTVDVTAAVGR